MLASAALLCWLLCRGPACLGSRLSFCLVVCAEPRRCAGPFVLPAGQPRHGCTACMTSCVSAMYNGALVDNCLSSFCNNTAPVCLSGIAAVPPGAVHVWLCSAKPEGP